MIVRTPARRSEWIASFGANPEADSRLVCVPYAGGTCTAFKGWRRRLPDVEILPVQFPGRGSRRRESCCTDAGQLVRSLADAVEPWLDRPYSVAGLCFGGILGFELARTLAARGARAPEHLFVIGRSSPQTPMPPEPGLSVSDDELVEQMRISGATPQVVLDDPAALRQYLPMVRSDIELVDSYRYVSGLALESDITVFAGRDDHATGVDLLGWERHTVGRFEMRWYDGDHFFFRVCEDRIVADIRDRIGSAREALR